MNARERAAEFVLGARDEAGWWRDFTAAGPSDQWVTAYVAWALAGYEPARTAATQAWRLLADAQVGGGWSYHPRVPPDADSTSWALRLAEALGVPDEPAAAAGYDTLRRHLGPEGGLSTYSMEVAGPVFLRYPFIESWAGWMMTHACVTAAGAALRRWPEHERLIGYLRDQQQDDGGWPDYWWVDREYGTALAVEALAAAGGHLEAIRRAGVWAAGRVGADGAVRTELHSEGSAFATALAARALACLPEDGPASAAAAHGRALDWLAGVQRPDGSWAPSARLRIVPPGVTDPGQHAPWGLDGVGRESVGTIVVDWRAVFTTATALPAFT